MIWFCIIIVLCPLVAVLIMAVVIAAAFRFLMYFPGILIFSWLWMIAAEEKSGGLFILGLCIGCFWIFYIENKIQKWENKK